MDPSSEQESDENEEQSDNINVQTQTSSNVNSNGLTKCPTPYNQSYKADEETYIRKSECWSKYKNAARTCLPIRKKATSGRCPIERAGLFSYLTFQWVGNLLFDIYKNGIDEKKLWPTPHKNTADLNSRRLRLLWQQEQQNNPSSPSLFRALLRMVKTRVILSIVVLVIHIFLSFISPAFVLRSLLEYVESEETNHQYGLLLAFSFMLTELVRSLSLNAVWAINHHTGIRLRVAVSTLLFEKILYLRHLQDKSAGQLNNMLYSDCHRLMEAAITGCNVISGPVSTVLCLVYLYLLIGPTVLIGFSVIFLFYPFQVVLSRLYSTYRRKLVEITDQRVRLMTEILTSMKLIKMYAWEKPFTDSILAVREREKKVMEKTSSMHSISYTLTPAVPTTAVVLTVITHTLLGYDLTAAEAFTMLAIFNTIRPKLSVVPNAVRVLAESKISARRIQNVLEMENIHGMLPGTEEDIAISFNAADIAWDRVKGKTGDIIPNEKSTEETKILDEEKVVDDEMFHTVLHDIDLKIEVGELVGICGSVGCGKSSILSAVLGQMHIMKGSINVNGKVALVAQQSWVMNTSVRENITFQGSFDENKYSGVVEACGLKKDIKAFPAGDETEIGERGINLSGGQKQRVSLARAVYSDLDIYLLDDPLSAVDGRVGNFIFRSCIKNLLKEKTVIFVTHQLQYLRHCDRVVYMKDGKIEAFDTPENLMHNNKDYELVIKKYIMDTTKKHVPIKLNVKGGKRLSRSSQHLSVLSQNRASYLSLPAELGLDPMISPFSSIDNIASMFSDSEFDVGEEAGRITKAEEVRHGAVEISTFLSYMRAAGGYFICSLTIFLFFITIMSVGVSNWWLSYWISEASGNYTYFDAVKNKTVTKNRINDNPNLYFYHTIFAVTLVGMILLALLRCFAWVKTTLRASIAFHQNLFNSILRAPMTFFDTTPIGQILNRFSKDLDDVDIGIPFICESFLQHLFLVILSIGVVSIVFPWFLLVILPLFCVFLILQKVFRQSSRELKRLDGMTRSPIFSAVTTCVQGLSTIQTFKKQKYFVDSYKTLVDKNIMTYFLFLSAKRWLTARLDLIAIICILSTALFIVFFKDTIPAAYCGLAISFAVSMTGLFQLTVRLAADAEAQFVSVERLNEYIKKTKPEAPNFLPHNPCPKDWPKNGTIVFESVDMRYRSNLPLVLNEVSFSIKGQEKVGIVGRTGSGKSSLGVCLFRLVEICGGSIKIDDVDLSTIGLYDLRSRLSIIPQDPELFVGTLRFNLDPFSKYSDDQIWDALRQCFIADRIENLPAQLESPVVENGENFSVGERQLICLARALLRESQILVLDEATASIDAETDSHIQATIKTAFSHFTVLTVAHRLNTVLNYDRILVLKQGRVIEFDKPDALLSNPNSEFSAMLSLLDTE